MFTLVGLFLVLLFTAWISTHVANVFKNKDANRKQEHRDVVDIGRRHLAQIQTEQRYEESLSKREQQANRELKALAQEKLLAKKALSAHADLLTDDEKQKLQNFIEG